MSIFQKHYSFSVRLWGHSWTSELPVKLLRSYIPLLHHCTSGFWGLEMDRSCRLELLPQGSIGASHVNNDTTEKSKRERSLCSTFPSFPLPFKHLLPWDHGCLKLPLKSTESDGHPWLGTPHIRAAPFELLHLSSLVTCCACASSFVQICV